MPKLVENYVQAWSDESERILATPSPFAKSTLFYIQEIGHFHTHPPYYTERAHLDSFLLVFTVNGAGKLTYRNKTYSLKSRRIFFIDCLNEHRYWTEPGETWELLWVHFNGHAARGYFEWFAEEHGPILDLPPDSPIPHLIRQMIQLQKQKSRIHELMGSKLLVDMLTASLLDRQPSETAVTEMPAFIRGLVQEIDQHYRQRLTLDRLARQFNVSKYHLAKEFKRHTGFTPNEYVIITRITRAKEWLQYSDRSIADIAAEVGIDNVSHFINLFKDREGSTPLVFRKQWQRP